VCLLVVQNVQEGTFPPPGPGSWDHKTEPIQSFQTALEELFSELRCGKLGRS
jgi:hypothetical protein